MIERVQELVNAAYLAGRREGKYLVLDEAENIHKPGCLHEIKLYLKNVEAIVAYKFDQKIKVLSPQASVEYETYAPFLADIKGARSMCDFIIFYKLKNDEQIHVWVVNMKSQNLNNNVQQLRAANRIVEFLYGKLNDLLAAELNKLEQFPVGQVNFVLFSTHKSATNPWSGGNDVGERGRSPENFRHCLDAAQLAPIAG